MDNKIMLSDGTLKNLILALGGEARQLDDGTWIPMVFVDGEWQDSPKDEPSHTHRLEAVSRSRELGRASFGCMVPP